MEKKDIFEYLFDDLKGLYDTFIKYILTTTTTQLLIIGWFITSGNAPQFVAKTTEIWGYINYVVGFFVFIEIAICLFMWKASVDTSKLIKELDYMDEKYFKFKVINIGLVIGVIIGHVLLYLFLYKILNYVLVHPQKFDTSIIAGLRS